MTPCASMLGFCASKYFTQADGAYLQRACCCAECVADPGIVVAPV